jgi:hypothetical protein
MAPFFPTFTRTLLFHRAWPGGSFSTLLAFAQPRGDVRRLAKALAPRFAAR